MVKTMKILLISCRYYPEPFTITQIAEGLVKLGNEVTVLTGRPHYGKWKIYDGYESIKNETINGVKIIRVKEFPRKKGTIGLIRNYTSIYFRYKKALRKIDGDYDIVFSHVMSPIFSIAGVGKYCKRKKIPHFHYGFDLWPESLVATGFFKRKSMIFKYFKRVSRKIYSTCDLITFASPSAEKYFSEYLKLNVPFEHIYQPTLTPFPDDKDVFPIPSKSDKKTHLLFGGTIAKFNHLNLLIHALDDDYLRENIVLHIVGSGSDQVNIENLVSKLELENVIFHGRVSPSEMHRFYKECHAIYIPLYNNSATSLMIPQKVTESIMYGRIIVGMIQGDGKDIIEQASSKNIIVGQNVLSIRNGLLQLTKISEKEMETCGKENREYYLKNNEFSIDFVCNKINNSLINLTNDSK